jgi:hypothetical protein
MGSRLLLGMTLEVMEGYDATFRVDTRRVVVPFHSLRSEVRCLFTGKWGADVKQTTSFPFLSSSRQRQLRRKTRGK